MAHEAGHVAPAFPNQRFANAARLGPAQVEYRVTLRMGEIEDLFAEPPDTWKGRLARLQVLGLSYFPLKHKKAKNRFEECWKWVKEHVFAVHGEANPDQAADGRIQKALKERVVGGGYAPLSDGRPGIIRAGLPSPADPAPPAGPVFAKIRLPGGYTFMKFFGDPKVVNDNMQAPYSTKFLFGNGLYEAESVYYQENPVLGKIPLVAKVEMYLDGILMGPVEGAPVYFQLVDPYGLDPYVPATGVLEQVTPPNPPPPIQALVAGAETATAPTPIQGKNCPKSFGGKRGLGNPAQGTDVANVLFATKKIAGFNSPHGPSRPLPHKPYPTAKAVKPSGGKHEHSVRALTNEDGEAGVVFMPSRAGGDTYRIRAYVGPPKLESDGTGLDAAKDETGTLVVWRNIRLSRCLQKQVANVPISPDLLVGAPVYFAAGAAGVFPPVTQTQYHQRVGLCDPAGAWVGHPTFDFAALQERFARAFCELEFDGPAPGMTNISLDDYRDAYQHAVQDAKKAMQGMPYVLERLLLPEVAAYAGDSVALFPMRTAFAYNGAIAGLPALPANAVIPTDATGLGFPTQNVAGKLFKVFDSYLFPGFLRRLTRDCALPGLTILHTVARTTWHILYSQGATGMAFAQRGCLVEGGGDFYNYWDNFTENFTNVALHELGHCLYREHQPGGGAWGTKPAEHDAVPLPALVNGNPQFPPPAPRAALPPPPHPANYCLMSYERGPLDLCSKCLLALRGWKMPQSNVAWPP